MILQVIGRPEKYDEVSFEIEGKHYKTPFSSHALQKHFNENEEVLLLAPESLLGEYGNKEKLIEKIKEKDKEFNFFVEIIPSIGEYSFGDRKVIYRNNFDNVVIGILLNLVKRRPEKVLIDVSTGQNVYVFASIEAVRRYATYRQIERILQGYKFELKIATYQPILNVKEAKIEINDFSTRSFFYLPVVNPDKLCKSEDEEVKKKAGEIGKKYKKVKSEFRSVQEDVEIAFNAIRYNIPLAFYELLSFNVDIDEIEKGILELAEEFLKNEIPMNLGTFSNMLFTIAMFRSFGEFRSKLDIPCIEEVELKFEDVYKRIELGINCIFLSRELDEIKEKIKVLGERTEKEKILLLDLYKKDFCKIDAEGKAFGSKDAKRNFFAHSGFLKEWTFVKIIDGKICLEWDKNKNKEIRKWLLKPEN